MRAEAEQVSTAVPESHRLMALTRVVDKATSEYERRLALATDALKDASKSFSQTLITLCAGAVTLSVTYLKSLNPGSPLRPYAWASFGLALALSLVSFKLMQRPLSKEVERLSLLIKRNERGLSQAVIGNVDDAMASFVETADEIRLRRVVHSWRRVVNTVDVISVIAFIAGVVLLLRSL